MAILFIAAVIGRLWCRLSVTRLPSELCRSLILLELALEGDVCVMAS